LALYFDTEEDERWGRRRRVKICVGKSRGKADRAKGRRIAEKASPWGGSEMDIQGEKEDLKK